MLQILAGKKSYYGREILNIPLLNLDKGVYWLQGMNGSGKTTLLRMIAGLIPFNGDILAEGISLQQDPLAYRRKVSWAEAEPLYPGFITGQELVSFYQDIRKASSLQVDKLVNLFGMQSYLSAPIGSYSSGMIKRLSLALAFMGEPSLILLDEPLATLDAEAALLLPGLMKEYQQDRGTSFIFSSHHHFETGALLIDKKLMITDQSVHFSA